MRHAIASVVLLLLAACGTETVRQSHLDVGAACTEDSECQSSRCLDGKCRARCEVDADCHDAAMKCDRGGCFVRPVVCGDGVLDAGEECDDHNTASGDGCSATCHKELVATWDIGSWGACSTTCGEGSHLRTVVCRIEGEEVPDGRCGTAKPSTIEACEDRSGCTCSPATCTGICTLTEAGESSVTIPADCKAIRIEAWGGGGAGGNQQGATGGGAGYATGKFAVGGGETLAVEVAEGGTGTGDGGGASSVKKGATVLVVAAGGGGGGSDGCSGCATGGAGGAGGGDSGEDGANLTNGNSSGYCTSATGGKGGTQESGGNGGNVTGAAEYKCAGGSGGALSGGPANGTFGTCNSAPGPTGWHAGGGQGNGGGGAGGAGWFGGGGAGFIWTYCAGGGGGGSSHLDASATNVQLLGGSRRQAGAGSMSEGAGMGGNPGGSGTAGRVVIHFGG